MLSKTSSALASQSISDSAATEFSRYLYDPVGRLKETYNDHQYIAFQYDRRGRLIREHHSDLNTERQRISGSMVDIHYQRYASGQLKKLQLPHGQTIDYQYDNNDRFHQALFNGTAITTIERDTVGFERNRQQGALTTYSDYDPMGRLIKQRTEHQQQKAGVIQREYQYDPFGNLSVFKDGIGKDDAWEVRYVYDMVDRLKRTQGDLIENFVFDPAGNLLTQQKKEHGKTTKGNRLTLQGDRKFDYDARGNLIRETRGKGGKLETVFEYNFNNQLCKVIKDGQTTEYTYDPLGRRIRKQDNFGVTHYLWTGDQLAQEKRNNIQKTYIYEPDSFKPIAMVQDGEIYHYHLDHLGTPRELTNQQGKLVWKARYKTYGNVAVKDIEEIENNLRFQGQYFDQESGLHYNRHRYYDPSIGQFTTQDPIGLLGGVNNYQYAPNPTGWIDPLGLTCKENTWNTFQKNTAGHFKDSSLTPSSSYQKMKEVQAMEKGNRPDPSTYLPQSYIDAHLAQFDAGVSRFMTKTNFDKYGPGQRNGTSFVMTKHEADAVLVNANGDKAIMESTLGLPDGFLSSNELIRVDITDPKSLGLRMPSGNEAGANEYWLAGGKLPDGNSEAIIDVSRLSPSQMTTQKVT